jgi:hypothetical protein
MSKDKYRKRKPDEVPVGALIRFKLPPSDPLLCIRGVCLITGYDACDNIITDSARECYGIENREYTPEFALEKLEYSTDLFKSKKKWKPCGVKIL